MNAKTWGVLALASCVAAVALLQRSRSLAAALIVLAIALLFVATRANRQ